MGGPWWRVNRLNQSLTLPETTSNIKSLKIGFIPKGNDRLPTIYFQVLSYVTLRIQVCPKSSGFPLQSYSGDGMFRPSILLDREGSGFLGLVSGRVKHCFNGCFWHSPSPNWQVCHTTYSACRTWRVICYRSHLLRGTSIPTIDCLTLPRLPTRFTRLKRREPCVQDIFILSQLNVLERVRCGLIKATEKNG